MKHQRRYPLFFTIATLLISCTLTLAAQPPSDTLGIGPRVNLGDGVNSEWAELVPRLNGDASRLYFVRKHATSNIGGVEDQDDIYVSERNPDGTWSTAKNVGEPLNSAGSDVLFWIAPDESVALLYHGRKVDGREQGLSIARRNGSTWSRPEAISIEGVESLGQHYYATLYPDRSLLLVAFAPGDDPYNLDLHFCERIGSDLTRWGPPVPIEGINSPFIEGGASFSSDGQSLFFSSDRPGGRGLGDIYITRRASERLDFWTPPENLELNVNSQAFEADATISPDGRYLYVSRIGPLEPESFGRTDIWRHDLPEQIELRKSVMLEGIVQQSGSGPPIAGADITLEVVGEGRIVASTRSDGDGRFRVLVLPGVNMKIVGRAAGYQQSSSILDLRRRRGGGDKTFLLTLEPAQNVQQTPAVDEVIVNFSSGSTTLDRTSRRRAKRFFLAWQEAGSTQKIVVTGHTDSVGSEEQNRVLAENRARVVADLFRSLGVPESLLRVETLGESKPLTDNADEAGRRANRRVVIRVE